MDNIYKTITLVMIVKNESHIIKRCFDSVKKYIDFWVICDTGSTDGTQQIIKEYFDDAKIPGELHETEWVNFGFNRTIVISLAKNKSDYSLLFDADMIFNIKDENFKNNLSCDSYQIKYDGALDYRTVNLVNSKYDWEYIGVTHEYLHCKEAYGKEKLDSFTIIHKGDGGSKSDKFIRDIKLLTQGITDEPTNYRYKFYLAQSYKDICDYTNAINYYKMCISINNWEEEVYYSLFQIGYCKMMRGDKYLSIQDAFIKAYKYRPSRLEALYELVKYCRLNNMSKIGYEYGYPAINTSYPSDILFINKKVHEWMFLDEVALCAYNIDKPEISIELYDKFLRKEYENVNDDNRIKNNYNFFEKKVEQQLNEKTIKNNLNKVAIIIVNYNMLEKTDQIIENLNKTVKYPHDIILVDNGSNFINESKYTSLRLQKNVQTNNGWLMGLHYADSLEIINNEKYFAYCFVLTSVKLIETEKDIIETMINTMKKDDNVVGVHPSLTTSSLTHRETMINTPDKGIEHLFFIDNIFSCYRASWFNKIGRFNSKLTFDWGIDIETGYFADIDNKKILLDNTIKIEKDTEYKTNIDNAINQINNYFSEKYGSDYSNLLYKKINFKCNYTNTTM